MSAPTTERSLLSVVIASSNRGALLERCVQALEPQAGAAGVEVLVVRASDLERGTHRGASASVRWIDAPAGSTVPELRGLGIAEARGDRIALLEDDCVVASDWCTRALATDASAAAVGGAVEPGPYERVLDWAVYFCEYGRFMRPLTPSPSAPITGNNVVYSREALSRLPAATLADFREAFVHAHWQNERVRTTVDGGLVVTNVNRWTAAHVTSIPFHHGRAYAGRRFAGRGMLLRVGMALLTLGLPLLKTARIAGEVLSRRRRVGRLVMAFPWILVFVTSWSAGELIGCLMGPGGSAERWR